MSNPDVIRIFVGGNVEHWLPTKVLEHSILRRTPHRFDFTRLWDSPISIPTPKDPGNRPATSFSLQRFLVPEICDFEGKGIYLDSDMIVWGDVKELWNMPFPEKAKLLAPPGWQSAVLVWDCTIGIRIGDLVADMDAGKCSYSQLMNLKGLDGVSRSIDPNWNCLDRPDLRAMVNPQSRLLHYTDMRHQPWLRAGHPAEEVWLRELKAALRTGHIARDDILREIDLQHIRPSLAAIVGTQPDRSDDNFKFPNDRRVLA